jgi:DNA-binding transcriptional regulator YiaG
MVSSRQNISWAALPGVVLLDIPVQRCAKCGEHTEEYRALGPLSDAIAVTVAQRPERLTGAEVRFLRSHLELNGAEFARVVGSTASTIARWENQRQPIGLHAELLIRAMVLLKHGVVTTPTSIKAMARSSRKPPLLRFAYRAGQWRVPDVQKVAA